MGLWAPIAACWVAVVLAIALFREVAVGIGISVALLGPLAGIIFAVSLSRTNRKSSLHVLAASPHIADPEWFRRGLKKGLIAGPESVIGVGMLAT